MGIWKNSCILEVHKRDLLIVFKWILALYFRICIIKVFYSKDLTKAFLDSVARRISNVAYNTWWDVKNQKSKSFLSKIKIVFSTFLHFRSAKGSCFLVPTWTIESGGGRKVKEWWIGIWNNFSVWKRDNAFNDIKWIFCMFWTKMVKEKHIHKLFINDCSLWSYRNKLCIFCYWDYNPYKMSLFFDKNK